MACEYCGLSAEEFVALRQEVERLSVELARADKRIGIKEREIDRLKREQADELRFDVRWAEAVQVLDYWQSKLAPGSREPYSPKRVRPVFARLGKVHRNRITVRHYDVDILKRCIDGYAAFPYQGEYGKRMATGRTDQLKIDADFIFDSERRVQQGLRMADQVDQHRRTFADQACRDGLSEIGQRAVHLARLGWHVFPCIPNAKQPATSHGLLDAHADVQRIERYWRARPDANLAVRCGVESGVVVLDVDGDDGYESLRTLERAHGALPKTLSVITPRGGQHFYFQRPAELRNAAGVRLGLDFRGDGGYVLCPPSRVDGRTYEVDESVLPAAMPEWLIRLLVEHQQTIKGKLERGQYAELLAECVGEGQRNERMTQIVGHEIALKGVDRAGEVLEWALMFNAQKCRPPLPTKEVEAVVTSIASRQARKPLRAA